MQGCATPVIFVTGVVVSVIGGAWVTKVLTGLLKLAAWSSWCKPYGVLRTRKRLAVIPGTS